MKYTKEQLHAMSDLEINQLLTAYALGNPWLEFGELVNEGKEFHVANAVGEPFYCAVINYCNNPSDIMPLAFENKLRITPHVKSMWLCLSNHKDARKRKEYFDKKPLRAIACCLILALQGEKE